MFLLLAPASMFFIAWFMHADPNAKSPGFLPFVAMVWSFLSLSASAITGPVDGYLARSLPIVLRAPLTTIVGAMAGATVGCGFAFIAFRLLPPPSVLISFTVSCAVVMGGCSLLSHDHGRQRPTSTGPAGL
ncbi:hypothetical protein [Bradyrhizobium sp. AZCC 1614]|uniref:hypothetical protein n=1 Tax=Bradyrhizobium sp. AZCC 1614 TaxID=3117017 RepID=UPI002FEEC866